MPDFAPVDRLRAEILVGLGLALPLTLACGAGKPSDDASVTTDMSSGADMGDTDESADESEDTSGTDDPPSDECAVTYLGALPTLDGYPSCNLPTIDPGGCPSLFYLACVAAAPGQSCEQQCAGELCGLCVDDPLVPEAIGGCGPYEVEGQCCSLLALDDDCGTIIDGRPFVVHGVARVARLEQGALTEPKLRLSARLCRHLAGHWARIARAEHASIASFARFGAELLALGAPSALVRDACAAAQDEVRHAEVALGLASRFARRRLTFGSLEVEGAVASRGGAGPQLEVLVRACISEGCIGETLAALRLAKAASACEDPELARVLRAISDDEARHASLAWRVVQWALGRDPSLAATVAEAFAALRVSSDHAGDFGDDELRVLAAHGCLAGPAQRELQREGVEELLRPCAAALLSRTG